MMKPKTQYVFLLVCLVYTLCASTNASAQTSIDHKSYELKLGNRWCPADSGLTLAEFYALDSFVLREKHKPNTLLLVDSCNWSVNLLNRGMYQTSNYHRSYNLKEKGLKQQLNECKGIKKGDIFFLQEIKLVDKQSAAPKIFRVVFK
jgi:hypothetical protein